MLPLTRNADATHIFDGLQSFPTHICHLQLGKTPTPLVTWPIQQSADAASAKHSHSDLLEIALEWLTEDRELRRKLEKEKGKKSRGARKTDVRTARSVLWLALTIVR
jgi:CCR4-NOT complex subunit CAF16